MGSLSRGIAGCFDMLEICGITSGETNDIKRDTGIWDMGYGEETKRSKFSRNLAADDLKGAVCTLQCVRIRRKNISEVILGIVKTTKTGILMNE